MAILDSAREAMGTVGQRYEEGTYFLPELMLAGEMLNQITDILKPELAKMPEVNRHGKVLIGTVKGDIHDIGKDIVTFMLDVNGFDVLDLGVDVSPQKFVETIQDFEPQVVGLSGFLTLAFDAMKETVEAIKTASSRDRVKIMIGGGQINEQICHTDFPIRGQEGHNWQVFFALGLGAPLRVPGAWQQFRLAGSAQPAKGSAIAVRSVAG